MNIDPKCIFCTKTSQVLRGDYADVSCLCGESVGLHHNKHPHYYEKSGCEGLRPVFPELWQLSI